MLIEARLTSKYAKRTGWRRTLQPASRSRLAA
jgi:hypothetical protein